MEVGSEAMGSRLVFPLRIRDWAMPFLWDQGSRLVMLLWDQGSEFLGAKIRISDNKKYAI